MSEAKYSSYKNFLKKQRHLYRRWFDGATRCQTPFDFERSRQVGNCIPSLLIKWKQKALFIFWSELIGVSNRYLYDKHIDSVF